MGRNIPNFWKNKANCYYLRTHARQNADPEQGLQDYTVTWSDSCQKTVYLFQGTLSLPSQDFMGGWTPDSPLESGWTVEVEGTGNDGFTFATIFNGKTTVYNSVFSKVVSSDTLTFPIFNLWNGGVVVCRDQDGPCAGGHDLINTIYVATVAKINVYEKI